MKLIATLTLFLARWMRQPDKALHAIVGAFVGFAALSSYASDAFAPPWAVLAVL